MQFIDKCVIELQAGDGGDGIVAWRREAHYPEGGPWGGDGGRGGDIFIYADHNENSLFKLRYLKKIKSNNGENGKSKLCHGANGKGITINVPLGSVIKDAITNEVIFDCINPGEVLRICKGGEGGHGNAFFKSSKNKAPKLFERGDKGESRKILIELKFIADVGLLGLPNAGKSTFVKNISSAQPKTAPYKFTTLVPVLGTFYTKDKAIVFADIPGLIENAAEGQGLGHEFLKHIERCKILVHLISLSSIDNEMDDTDVIKSYEIIRNEIKKYNEKLFDKKIFIVANKIDAEGSEENLIKLKNYLKNKEIYVISGINKNFGNLLINIEKEYDLYINKIDSNIKDKIKVVKETKEEKDEIIFKKIDDCRWLVSSKKIDYWFNKIPHTTDENWIRLNQKIDINKIEKILKGKGAKSGDIMVINDIEYVLD
ncbi:MAG: GTPase ObgE [Mycoplasmoidaceae bacterium]